jgi:hypothetical protein
MVIDVLQEDIDAGEGRSCINCPIARAILRQTGAKSVVVKYDRALVDGIRYWLPLAAQSFIGLVDHGMMPLPISFELFDTNDSY